MKWAVCTSPVSLDVELQPRLAGYFHLGQQQQPLVLPEIGHLPEIQGITDPQVHAVPPAPIKAIAA